MRTLNWPAGLGAAALLIAVGAVAIAAVDPAQIVKQRADTMKRQGADMGKIKAFLDGKGELPAAQTSAADLIKTMEEIPGLFPPGTDMISPDGKWKPKPAVWTDWNNFLSVRSTAADKAHALSAAATSGDKAKIQAAFADLGKNGCGACHEKFREKIQ